MAYNSAVSCFSELRTSARRLCSVTGRTESGKLSIRLRARIPLTGSLTREMRKLINPRNMTGEVGALRRSVAERRITFRVTTRVTSKGFRLANRGTR